MLAKEREAKLKHNKFMRLFKIRRPRLALIVAGLSSLALITLLLTLSVANNQEASAKNQVKADSKDLVKTLDIVSVDSPTSFQGVGRYPTKAQNGQRLVAVTVAFDRSFIEHLRASESGEVYLTSNTQKATFYTVDTAYPKSDGPGKKPNTRATFVFSVPVGNDSFTFHYAQYSVPLAKK